MKTRSKVKKAPEIIEIKSEPSCEEEMKEIDSSCSDVSGSELSNSSYEDSNNFLNLAPV